MRALGVGWWRSGKPLRMLRNLRSQTEKRDMRSVRSVRKGHHEKVLSSKGSKTPRPRASGSVAEDSGDRGQEAEAAASPPALLVARVKITAYNYHRSAPFLRALVDQS